MDTVKAVLKRLFAWGLAVLTTTAFAVIFQSQNIIARLNGLGGNIGLSERLSVTFFDLTHLGSLYGIFISIALAIAFLCGALVYKIAKFGRPVIYICAGAIAMIVMLLMMKEVFFGVAIIAGARDMTGLAFQMVAGGLGGFVFSKISQSKQARKNQMS